MVALGKIGVTLKGIGHRFMAGEFLTIVEGDGLDGLGGGAQQGKGGCFDVGCCLFTWQWSGQAQF